MRKEVQTMDSFGFIASVIAGVVANIIFNLICKWLGGDE